MLRFITRRLSTMVGLLFGVSIITFLLFSALPSDPAALTCGKNCTPEVIEQNRIRLGYDKPVLEQYGVFVSGIFTGRTYGSGTATFDCEAPCLGYSFNKGEEVTVLIGRALPATAQLAAGAFVLWIVMGLGIGIISALKRGKWQDRLGIGFALVGTSLPAFFTGLILIFTFVFWIPIFPAPRYVEFDRDPLFWLLNMLLPWITLALLYSAVYARLTRDGILETMNEDYVRTAKAKGLSSGVVVRKHVLRSALTPIVTIAGIDLAGLLGGAIVTEAIFSIPGLGRLTFAAISQSDLPVIAGTVILTSAFIILANTLVDIFYAVLDPRVSIQ
jgi:peptide/nickel transport system permease protein